jgi:hypothetical protein
MVATIVGLLCVVLGAGVFLVCLLLAIRWDFCARCRHKIREDPALYLSSP